MKIPKRITLKIDVDKVLTEHLFQGKKGKYLDVVLFNTPENQFGADYVVKQDLPREVRDAGTESPILGNARVFEPNGGDTNQSVGSPNANGNTPPQTPAFGQPTSNDGLPFG
tara:strand:- start:33 stop:368 length:336 start_codon:yes stop_codon:yes gene_type:complete